MENLLYALLGWVAGVFSNLILEWNRDKRHVGSLRNALRFEMKQFRNRMGNIVYMMSARSGTLTPQRLDWLIKEFEAYDGPDRNPQFVMALKTIREHPEEAAAAGADFAAVASQKSPRVEKIPDPYS